MTELSKASEAKLYFENIIKKLNGVKICAVFSASPWFNNNSGYRRYEDRSPIYIIFSLKTSGFKLLSFWYVYYF